MRYVAAALACVVVCACVAARPLLPVPRAYGSAAFGSGSAVPVAYASAAATVDCASPAQLAPEARGALSEVRAGFVSLGHAGGQFKATIKKGASLWVAEHRRVSDDEQGPVLAIEQRDGGWCYVVAEPTGAVLRSGVLADCAGCHDSAGAKPVFSAAP